jgi:tetratricopeptide (TPR) repeat protein
MADNRERNFDDLLMAYELGLLTEDERRRLEIHLLENDELMAEAGNFEEAIRLIKHDPDIRKAIAEADIDNKFARREEKKKSRLVTLIPVFATVAVFLILLIVQPWEVQIRPSKEVVASENRLAVVPFANLSEPADPQRLGQIWAGLLISDLSESEYLRIVPLQQINDILEEMTGTADSVKIDRCALDIALQSGAKWVLTGTIMAVQGETIITTRLLEAATGDMIKRREFRAGDSENIFGLIDSISVLVKEDMTLPQKAFSEPDRRVADITTHSQKAYFYFLEGTDQSSKMYYQDAKTSFNRALEYDSTFAMAHYYLSRITSGEKRRYHIEQAEKYSYKTGTKDKFLIEAHKAVVNRDLNRAIELLRLASLRFPDDKGMYYELAVNHYNVYQYAEAVAYAKKAIDIDPGFKVAYNQLAYAYHKLGDDKAALEAIDRYIELAPDEANPYDSRGDICMDAGILEEAIKSYEKALEIKPDYYKSRIYLGMLYIFKGDYEEAEATIRRILDSPVKNDRSVGRSLWAAILLRQGKMEEALQRLDFGIAADAQEQSSVNLDTEIHYKYLIKAFIFLEIGDTTRAIEAGEKFVALHRKYAPEFVSQWRQFYVQILAECGRYDEASRIAAELKADIDSVKLEPFPYYYATGAIAFARGDYEAARPYFERLLTLNTDFYAGYMYARTLHESGRPEAAIREYESLTRRYRYCWPLYFGVWGVELHYYLARALEEVGRHDDAVGQYERFIELWKNADRPLAKLDEARNRRDRLKHMQ